MGYQLIYRIVDKCIKRRLALNQAMFLLKADNGVLPDFLEKFMTVSKGSFAGKTLARGGFQAGRTVNLFGRSSFILHRSRHAAPETS